MFDDSCRQLGPTTTNICSFCLLLVQLAGSVFGWWEENRVPGGNSVCKLHIERKRSRRESNQRPSSLDVWGHRCVNMYNSSFREVLPHNTKKCQIAPHLISSKFFSCFSYHRKSTNFTICFCPIMGSPADRFPSQRITCVSFHCRKKYFMNTRLLKYPKSRQKFENIYWVNSSSCRCLSVPVFSKWK